jgi:hypothetical protein
MKRFLLLLLVAFCAGCVSSSSPAKDPVLVAIDDRFGLTAIHALLENFIRGNPNVDGVELQPGSLGDADSWVVDKTWAPPGLSCGDWTFQRKTDSETDFVLIFRVDPKSAIILHCRLNQRASFEILSFGCEEKKDANGGDAL